VGAVHTGLEGAAHARASGKLLLALAAAPVRETYLARHALEAFTERTITSRAELEREFESIRAAGHAVDDEEFAPGVACVAAPIVIDRAAIGAFSVSAPLARFRERRRWLTDAVLAAARSGATAMAREDPFAE
jgi:DNA-binding IclR family transcriptional regulator